MAPASFERDEAGGIRFVLESTRCPPVRAGGPSSDKHRPLSSRSLAHVFYFEPQRHAKYGPEIIADLYSQSPHL
jgi:hypothetical protein